MKKSIFGLTAAAFLFVFLNPNSGIALAQQTSFDAGVAPARGSQCVSRSLDRGTYSESRVVCVGDEVVTLTASIFSQGFVLGRVTLADNTSGNLTISVPGRGDIVLNLQTSGRDLKTGYVENDNGSVQEGSVVVYCDRAYNYSRIRFEEMDCDGATRQSGVVERIFRNPYSMLQVQRFHCENHQPEIHTDCTAHGGVHDFIDTVSYTEDAPLYLIRKPDGTLVFRHLIVSVVPRISLYDVARLPSPVFNFRVGRDSPRNDFEHLVLSVDSVQACIDACANNSRCDAFTFVRGTISGLADCWLKNFGRNGRDLIQVEFHPENVLHGYRRDRFPK